MKKIQILLFLRMSYQIRRLSGMPTLTLTPMPMDTATSTMNGTVSSTDLRRSLVNAPGDQAYPIVSFTWMLIAPQRIGPVKSRQLVEFLRWALGDGGDMAGALGYVALPTVTATQVLSLLESMAAAPTPPRPAR